MSSGGASEPPKADPWVAVARYLLDSKRSSLRSHDGVCLGKRVRFFRGKRAVQALMAETYRAEVPEGPQIRNRAEAKKVLEVLVGRGYLMTAERVSGRTLQPSAYKEYHDERMFVWLYQDPASQKSVTLKAVLVVSAALVLVMFPLWPYPLRSGVWYLSLYTLIAVLAVMLIRIPVFYISRLTHPPGLWILPNINEDVSFTESFRPLWAWDDPEGDERRRREREQRGSGAASPDHDSDSEGDEAPAASAPKEAEPEVQAQVLKASEVEAAASEEGVKKRRPHEHGEQ